MSQLRACKTFLNRIAALHFSFTGQVTIHPKSIAKDKHAIQSTNYAPPGQGELFPADLAVDGVPAVCIASESEATDRDFSQTEREKNQWFYVDLGKVYTIYNIGICNRGGNFSKFISPR